MKTHYLFYGVLLLAGSMFGNYLLISEVVADQNIHIARSDRRLLHDELTAKQVRLYMLEEKFRTWDILPGVELEMEELKKEIELLKLKLSKHKPA